MQNNLNNKYSLTLRILHWIIALIILAIFFSGFIMSDLEDNNILLKRFLNYYHKSFGVLLFILAILRIIVRLSSKTPSYNNSMPKFMEKIAKITHLLLYFLMIAVPLSGIGMVQLSSRKLFAFGFEIPNLFPMNNNIASILYQSHKILPYLLISLVVLHIAATLKHIFINKDDIFNRITIAFNGKRLD
jgi:cytochrome b561